MSSNQECSEYLASILSYPMKNDRIMRAPSVHRVRLQIGSQASLDSGKLAEQADQSSYRCSGVGLPRRWSSCPPLHFIALLEQRRTGQGILAFSKKHPFQRLGNGNRDKKTVVLTQPRVSWAAARGSLEDGATVGVVSSQARYKQELSKGKWVLQVRAANTQGGVL